MDNLETITVYINGEEQILSAPCTIALALAQLNLATSSQAVAVNQQFVPRSQHATHTLAEGDFIDIVAPMQGG